MQTTFIGDIIKKKRFEMGVTQEQLCEGICEPITISRLENGKQTPSRNIVIAILERLGLPEDRYYGILNRREIELMALQDEINDYNARLAGMSEAEVSDIRKEVFDKQAELERMIDDGDLFSRQLLIVSKIMWRNTDHEYSSDEMIEKTTEAIRLTCHGFKIDSIGEGLYSKYEAKLINYLAHLYKKAGKTQEAMHIYEQLLEYMEAHSINASYARSFTTVICLNYALLLNNAGNYSEGLRIADTGRQICVEHGYYQSLSGLLSAMATAKYHLGDREESESLFMQSLYIFKAIGDRSHYESTRQNMEMLLGISVNI